MKILEKQLELTKKGTRYALLSVVETEGEAPFEIGEKMILLEDGGAFGAIGDVAGELSRRMREDALENMSRGKAYTKKYEKSAAPKSEPLKKEEIAPQKEDTPDGFTPFGALDSDDSFSPAEDIKGGFATFGALGNQPAPARPETEREKPAVEEPPYRPAMEEGGFSARIFVEYFIPVPHIVVCGGEEVASALLELAKFLDFETTWIDTRDEKSVGEAIRFVDDFVRCDSYKEGLDAAGLPDNTYFVIGAPTAGQQKEALEGVLQRGYRYVGMLGSTKKKEEIFPTLLEQGVSKKKLDEVRLPAGMDISNETPREMAVAVIAEILAAKNDKN